MRRQCLPAATPVVSLSASGSRSGTGCLIDDELPVSVPYALSDIDLVAMRADLSSFDLPDGTSIGPRVIVEAKAEHDWDIAGRDFGAALRKDLELMGDQMSIPLDARGVKFVMLRQQHYERAETYFGTQDFVRLFCCPCARSASAC